MLVTYISYRLIIIYIMKAGVCLSVRLSVRVSVQIFISSLLSNRFQEKLYIMTSHVENKPLKIFAWPSENKQTNIIYTKNFGLMPLLTLSHSYCRFTMCLCKHQYLLQFSLDFQGKHILRLSKPWCIQEN